MLLINSVTFLLYEVSMSRWVEQFNSHGFHALLEQIEVDLKLIKLEDINPEGCNEISRISKVVSYIRSVFDLSDPELVQLTLLDSVSQNLSLARDRISSFNQDKNVGHLVEVNRYLDQVMQFVSQIPYIKNDREKKAVIESSKSFSKSLSAELGSYQKKSSEGIDTLKSQLAELSPQISASVKAIEDLKNQINSIQQTIQSQTSEFNKQFSAGETDRGNKFDNAIKLLNSRVDDEFKNLSLKLGEAVNTLAKYLDDSEKIFGIVTNTLQAGAYSSYANSEKKTANLYRYLTLSAMVLGVAFLVGPEILKMISDLSAYSFDWQKAIGRLPISLVLFVPAFYMARESAKHRNNEILNRRRELILSTIDPYLALLDKDKGDQIKLEIAKGIFSEGQTVDVNNSNDVGNILAQITNLAKQLMGK
jgi:predicted  nucleic acid-binding Zn-ribbon protein